MEERKCWTERAVGDKGKSNKKLKELRKLIERTMFDQ
jgi:hypothetical protein